MRYATPLTHTYASVHHLSNVCHDPTWNYVESIKNLPENINRKFTIRIPEEHQEFLALSTTDLPNVFVADCITTAVKAEVITEVSTMTELDFETFELRKKGTPPFRLAAGAKTDKGACISL